MQAVSVLYLISIFALGIFMLIRKYIKIMDIRVELPEGLRDSCQAPTNDELGTKSELFPRHEVFSYVRI